MVVITNRCEPRLSGRVAANQQFEQFILGRIGVLVLINQDMPHEALPTLPGRLMVLHQFQGQADEVVKIHTLVGRQTLFVMRHHPRNLPFAVVFGGQRRTLGIEAHVFPQADGPLPLPGRGGVDGASCVFQDAGDVIAVEDRKLGLEAKCAAVLTQHSHAQGVECANQHLPRRDANQPLGTFTHFRRGLVGEGDGGNAARRHPGLNQAGNLMGDHPGLA